jgi:hypothetical protein
MAFIGEEFFETGRVIVIVDLKEVGDGVLCVVLVGQLRIVVAMNSLRSMSILPVV